MLVDLVASRLISWLETVLVCSGCGRLDLIDMEVPSILMCDWDDEWIVSDVGVSFETARIETGVHISCWREWK